VDEVTHQPILSILSLIVETALKLQSDGHRVVLVSSGAIGVGLKRMDMAKKPKHLPQIQVGILDDCQKLALTVLSRHLQQSANARYLRTSTSPSPKSFSRETI
jgi:glutamate 5-kinase